MTVGAEQGRLVLVVDPDLGFADRLSALLPADRVVGARSIPEACAIAEAGRFDVAVVGPSFASEEGVTEAGVLRSADRSLLTVLVAEVPTNRLLRGALRSGFADVVDAPLSARKLTEVLARIDALDAERSVPVVIKESAPVPRETAPESMTAPTPVLPPVAEEEPPPEPPPAEEMYEPYPVYTDTGEVFTPAADEGTFAAMFAAADPATVVSPPEFAPPPVEESVVVVAAMAEEPPAPEPVPAAPVPAQDASFAPPPDPEPVPPPFPPVAEPQVATPPMPEAPPPLPAEPDSPEPAPMPPMIPVAATTEEPPEVHLDEPAAEQQQPPPFPRPLDPGPEDEGQVVPLPTRRPGDGRVITVMSGKGGSGKTITATNLAASLTEKLGEDTVVLVDADLQFGDVALMLQIDPTRTILEVVAEIDDLSEARLDALLIRHESGLRVLPAPLVPTSSDRVSPKDVVRIVEMLKGMYPFVIVDTPPIFDDGLMTVLEHSDDVLLIVDMDLPSVKNAKIALDTLRAIGYDLSAIRTVVNRANSKARLDLAELERALGEEVAASIPSDRLIPQSVNEGVPAVAFSPRSRVAKSFAALADLFLPGGSGR